MDNGAVRNGRSFLTPRPRRLWRGHRRFLVAQLKSIARGLVIYRAAGGATETEMFMGTDGEERLTDLALLDQLCIEKAEPMLAAQAKADGYLSGMFAAGCGHTGKKPKPPEGFTQCGYEYTVAAPEVKAQRIAIYTVNHGGDGLTLLDSYKPIEPDQPARPGYVPETAEQRAEREREHKTMIWQARLAVGSFDGTPLKGNAFWPNGHWQVVEWEYPEDNEDEEDGDEPDPISALVQVLVRVPFAAVQANRAEAEAKVADIEAEDALRMAEREARIKAATAQHSRSRPMSDPQAAIAFAHAEALAHATAELCRFGREGPAQERFPFGLDDLTAILAEALHFTSGIDYDAMGDIGKGFAAEEVQSTSQMRAALAKWMDDNGLQVPDGQ